MPSADVVVVGAGLAGLVAATRLAQAGAAVRLVAKGHATTHWGSGGIDVAAPAGAASPAEGIELLRHRPAHPYAILAGDVAPAVGWLLGLAGAAGLTYEGDLGGPIARVPTAIGGTRLACILPAAQAAATRAWDPEEILLVAGPAGFKDFWPEAVAASLRREHVWAGSSRPANVLGVTIDLPGLRDRRNLNALELARRFDDPRTRPACLDALRAAVRAAADGRRGRVALPAIIGLDAHPEAWRDLVAALPLAPFEVPLVPPSVPGIRLYEVLRAALRSAGGRLEIGEPVVGIERSGDRVTGVVLATASRTRTIRTGALVLATGGIAGGGIVGDVDGILHEPVLDLPVEDPGRDAWFAVDALDPTGHPLEAAGIRTDGRLRPVEPGSGRPRYANVHVAGALLAGARPLRERSGDGIAIASGWRAAAQLTGRDSGTPDSGTPDPVRPDTGRPDTGRPDTGTPAGAPV